MVVICSFCCSLYGRRL